MSHNVWNFVSSHRLSLDLAEFELSLFLIDFVSLVSSFGIIKNTEELSSLLNADNIHNTEGESRISSNFAVNLYHSFLTSYNIEDIFATKGVLKSISQKNGEWN